MKGMISEANDLISRSFDSKIKDVILISSIQYMKHFEIAGYGTAYSYTEALGYRDIADQLFISLEEEKGMDNHLSEIAINHVNEKAIPELNLAKWT
jgi:ferritin-like metal-binding protein YciE